MITPNHDRCRFTEMARETAMMWHGWQFDAAENIDDVDEGHVQPFATCPHPDCVLVRAVHPPADETPTAQSAWLIGLGSMPPQWWTGRGDEFTSEVDGTRLNPAKCAMRFARREDAERAIGWLVKKGTRDGCRAEEHLWA